ncbi:MAG: hypothetical protein VXW38_04135 [Bacteroidota bacterium]|nr:hypothetical protein [Bacteroidota bacterium]
MKQMIFVLTLSCFSSRMASQDQVVNGKLTVSDKLVIDNDGNFPAEGSISETSWGNYILTNNSASRALRLGVSNDWYTRGEIEIENNNSPSSSIYFKTTDTNGGAITRMKISGNGNVGIGTLNPGYSMDVFSSNFLLARFKRSGTGGGSGVIIENALGTGSWIYGVGSNNHFGVYKNGESNFGQQFIIQENGNVGIGTISPDAKLAVNGNIHAKEVKVDLTGWPDYVFKLDYNLPTLQEVEKHIKEKGHLINIPSAKEVEANGVELGEMNKLLLEKIEELTLYTIQQEQKLKRMVILEKEVENLKNILMELQNRK